MHGFFLSRLEAVVDDTDVVVVQNDFEKVRRKFRPVLCCHRPRGHPNDDASYS
jgi:hypothetical protein